MSAFLLRAVLLAALASTAALPAVSAQAVERPMTAGDLPSRLAPATRQAIVHLGDSLRAVGLPDAPLYAKAAEGVLKGAADARILVVLRALARELGDARASLGSGADEAELVAGASALHVGASHGAVSASPEPVARRLRSRRRSWRSRIFSRGACRRPWPRQRSIRSWRGAPRATISRLCGLGWSAISTRAVPPRRRSSSGCKGC